MAVMFEAGNPSLLQAFIGIQAAASGLGVSLRPFELRDGKDVEAAEALVLREPVDGLIVSLDRVTAIYRRCIVLLAARLHLPTVYGDRYSVVAGGLLSYGMIWVAQITRTADYVARILNGEKPANVPVQQPTRFDCSST